MIQMNLMYTNHDLNQFGFNQIHPDGRRYEVHNLHTCSAWRDYILCVHHGVMMFIRKPMYHET